MSQEEISDFNSFATDERVEVEASERADNNNEDDAAISTENLGKRKRKLSSRVWKHYNLSAVGTGQSGQIMGTCKYYKYKSYSAASRCGTSNFKRHLEVCEDYKNYVANGGGGSWKEMSQIVYREFLAEAIMRHGYSFSWVEHEANRKIHNYLNHNVQHISRDTAKKVCLDMQTDLKQKNKHVLGNLPGKICLTTDLWTACTSRGYICITAHYIDVDWKLSSKLLCFRHCRPPRGGIELSEQVTNVILDWGIKKKFFSLTVDNASNMDKIIFQLKHGVLRGLACNGKHFHVRCCAHILNLIVKDGLKVIDCCVAKVRDGVKYVDGSEARIEKFIEYANKFETPVSCGLWLDVPTRWNSAYLMLNRALKYRHVLDNYFAGIDGGSKYALNYVEWEKVEKICSLLEPFYEVTNLFSGSDYPTSNLYFPHVWKIHMRLLRAELCGDTDISIVATGMLEKFNKYWSEYVMVLAFGVIFDPRYKWEFVDFALKKVHGDAEGGRMANEVRIQFDELFKEYENCAGVVRLGHTNQRESTSAMQSLDDIGEFESQQIASSRTEVEAFLRGQRMPLSSNVNVLSYWKENAKNFPILSTMARDVLVVPITTVASESTFNFKEDGAPVNKNYNSDEEEVHLEA